MQTGLAFELWQTGEHLWTLIGLASELWQTYEHLWTLIGQAFELWRVGRPDQSASLDSGWPGL